MFRSSVNQNIPSKPIAFIPLLPGSVNAGYNRMINTIILCNAAASGYTNTINALLATHPRLVNLRDEKGLTALHHAARAGHCDTALSLLALGADIKHHPESPDHLPRGSAEQPEPFEVPDQHRSKPEPVGLA